MLTRATVKLVRSLAQKKCRLQERLFVGEGHKVVGDLMRRYQPQDIFATPEWQEAHPDIKATLVTPDELQRLSFLQHPQQVLATFRLPNVQLGMRNDELEIDSRQTAMREPIPHSSFLIPNFNKGLHIALDGVQDPGNLGTIIRIAAWFGVDTIICSPDTADAYNPKVVQATMGSLAGVNVVYTDLPQFIRSLGDVPVYGTLLDGENIYNQPIAKDALIVFGNEGNGISEPVRRLVSHRILIPSYDTSHTAESLNVAIAAAITLAEARRPNAILS